MTYLDIAIKWNEITPTKLSLKYSRKKALTPHSTLKKVSKEDLA